MVFREWLLLVGDCYFPSSHVARRTSYVERRTSNVARVPRIPKTPQKTLHPALPGYQLNRLRGVWQLRHRNAGKAEHQNISVASVSPPLLSHPHQGYIQRYSCSCGYGYGWPVVLATVPRRFLSYHMHSRSITACVLYTIAMQLQLCKCSCVNVAVAVRSL